MSYLHPSRQRFTLPWWIQDIQLPNNNEHLQLPVSVSNHYSHLGGAVTVGQSKRSIVVTLQEAKTKRCQLFLCWLLSDKVLTIKLCDYNVLNNNDNIVFDRD